MTDTTDTSSTTPSASDFLLSSSREYGIYVNKTRHIPNFADGLKDAMRKALYVMRSRGRIKTSALSGAMTEALLYAHGDASGSICSLAAPYGNNIPLLRGLGQFGTRIGPTEYAQPRYTEVERPTYASDLVYVDFDIIPMEPNYDGSTLQPVTLLPPLPLLLINGMEGVGVGWATMTLPRRPEEVARAVMAAISGEPIPQLKPYFNWCDCKVKSLGTHENGGSSWEFSGRVTIKDTSTLVVTDIPPMMKYDDFKRTLDNLEESEKINGYEEESSDEVRFVIKVKRGLANGWTEDDAIDYLRLKSRVTENIVVISPDSSGIVSYKEKDGIDAVTQYLIDWVKWRFSWYTKRYEKMLADDTDELTYMLAIRSCHRNEVPSRLRSMRDRDGLMSDIVASCVKDGVKPTDRHIGLICDMPIYRWTAEHMRKVDERIYELQNKVKSHKLVLNDESIRRGVFASDVEALVPTIKRAVSDVSQTRRPDV